MTQVLVTLRQAIRFDVGGRSVRAFAFWAEHGQGAEEGTRAYVASCIVAAPPPPPRSFSAYVERCVMDGRVPGRRS